MASGGGVCKKYSCIDLTEIDRVFRYVSFTKGLIMSLIERVASSYDEFLSSPKGLYVAVTVNITSTFILGDRDEGCLNFVVDDLGGAVGEWRVQLEP